MGSEDFFTTDSNHAAVDFIRSWPEWPEHHAIIVGPHKSGKKHLSCIWQENSKAESLTVLDDLFLTVLNNQHLKALILENVSQVAGDKVREEILFHLINRSKAGELDLLMLDAEPPSKWKIKLKDLKSRLKASPLLRIDPPDDLLLRVLILKQFSDRRLAISPEVLEYLSLHMTRNYEHIFEMIKTIDSYSLSTKRAVTIPLIRDILSHNNQ